MDSGLKDGRQMNRHRGMTIIELMMTMAVFAILLTVGVPSFITMTKNNRLATETNLLVSHINLARSEAVKRGVRVILCRSADPSANPPSCGGTANTWTTGWLVFASGDANTTYQAATDTLLKLGNPPGGVVAIKANAASNVNLEYNADGTTNEAGATAVFTVCDDRGEDYGRQVDIGPNGRPELTKGTSTTPLNDCANPA
jgi:type IV fimbrial biogenesis protein FimT